MGEIVFHGVNEGDADRWPWMRDHLLAWHVHGHAYLVREGVVLDIASILALAGPEDLVGLSMLVFDDHLLAAALRWFRSSPSTDG